jgi:ribosome-associated toxin RatA of RatAB toxin-antitoxin module
MKIISIVKKAIRVYAIIKLIQHYKKFIPIIIAIGKRLYKNAP